METSKTDAIPVTQRTGSEATTRTEKDAGADSIPATGATATPPDPEIPTSKALALIISVLMSIFLVALDRTIVSTAIPAITNEFNSLQDIGWYGSAYLLTCCAFQLQFGKIYKYFPVKYTFLISVLIFEVGSIVCGASPSSPAFIVGRAIAGLGAAGIFGGSIIVIAKVVPLHKRPKIQGLFGLCFAVATVAGPLGGAFTDNQHLTWRWCFYINAPIGAVTFFVVFLFLNLPDLETTKLPLKEKLAQLDVVGSALLIPGVVSLLLALQWGGQTYAWSDGRIIALLVLTGVLLIGFAVVQVLLPKTALIPVRILKQRSILAASWQTFNLGGSMYLLIYFIPIWFQTIEGVSAVESGIRFLPLMLSLMAGSILTGMTTGKLLRGYYTGYAIAGTCIMTVGAGLITTFQVSTTEGQWIGYQIVYGFGMGMAFQQGNLAAQTVLPMADVSIGIALMFFSQLIGGTIFISVGENVLDSQLISRLAGIPGFSPSLVTGQGATALLASLPESSRSLALPLYNAALHQVYIVALVLSALSVLGAVSLEWKSVNKDKKAAEEKKVSQEAQSQGEPTATAEKAGEIKETV